MMNRLCFVISILWLLMALGTFATREQIRLNGFDLFFAFLPIGFWLGIRLIYRYVRHGSLR